MYRTYLKEMLLRWDEIDSEAELEPFIERKHVLVETNGTWFRVVEVPVDGDKRRIPTVTSTVRSDGTRWIRAE